VVGIFHGKVIEQRMEKKTIADGQHKNTKKRKADTKNK